MTRNIKQYRYIEIVKGHWEPVIFNESDENLALFETCRFLPDHQLSVFIELMQILLGYTQLIVSGNQVSNRNQKKWGIGTKTGQIQVAGFTPFGWYILWKAQGF